MRIRSSTFKNGTSHKACTTRPKTQTTKQQGEMRNINQVRCEWRGFFILEYKRERNLWLKRKKAKWLGQRKPLKLFLNKSSCLKRENETLPYSRITHNTFSPSASALIIIPTNTFVGK